jgi:hypothetical protein
MRWRREGSNAAGPRSECTGTCVTLWTEDIRYKSLAAPRLKLGYSLASAPGFYIASLVAFKS